MTNTKVNSKKIPWSGRILGVQPRIRLMRSFDERFHSYLGFVLRISGSCESETGDFLVAVGQATQRKHQLEAGMKISAHSVPVDDPRKETASLYKTSGIKIIRDAEEIISAKPPFHGLPPDLNTYRARGHRRLATRTYDTKCTTCIWGCRMPVEIIIDQWNPSKRQYRFETFCYGPKNCFLYRPGAARKVLGRKGMSYIEEDWVDAEATAHRGLND